MKSRGLQTPRASLRGAVPARVADGPPSYRRRRKRSRTGRDVIIGAFGGLVTFALLCAYAVIGKLSLDENRQRAVYRFTPDTARPHIALDPTHNDEALITIAFTLARLQVSSARGP